MIKALQEAINEAKEFCKKHEVDIDSIKTEEGMHKLGAIDDAVGEYEYFCVNGFWP